MTAKVEFELAELVQLKAAQALLVRNLASHLAAADIEASAARPLAEHDAQRHAERKCERDELLAKYTEARRLQDRLIAMVQKERNARIKPGAKFLHKHQITRDSSPASPGGAVPETCTITAAGEGLVYFKNTSGFKSYTTVTKFLADELLRWLP